MNYMLFDNNERMNYMLFDNNIEHNIEDKTYILYELSYNNIIPIFIPKTFTINSDKNIKHMLKTYYKLSDIHYFNLNYIKNLYSDIYDDTTDSFFYNSKYIMIVLNKKGLFTLYENINNMFNDSNIILSDVSIKDVINYMQSLYETL